MTASRREPSCGIDPSQSLHPAPLHDSEDSPDRRVNPAAILVATNLKDLDRLMPFAFQMAGETGAHLLLLHVLPASASLTVDAAGMPYYDPAGAMEYAGKDLEPWCALARTRRLSCDAVIREGQAAHEILSAARQFHADWLVLGTRSRGKLGQLLLGSVAEQVLRSVTLPVITVGPEAHLPVDGNNHSKTVLHATTLGETSRPNAALACRIAARQGARLILLHVLPPFGETRQTGFNAELDTAVIDELHNLAADVGAEHCRSVEVKVLHGKPSIEILAEAAESHAQLIILGATRHTAFEKLARDRTIHRVLSHARCPVLTLRTQTKRAEHAEAGTLATQA